MDHSIVSTRYAKAYFSLAKEKNIVDSAKDDMELLSMICNESDEFKFLLESPVINTSSKIILMSKVFEGKIDDQSLQFLKLITENKREIFLPAICRNFLHLARKDRGIKTAVITSATAIAPATLDRIKTILEEELDSKIELSGRVNPAILGGLIVRVDDRQFDGSIFAQLKKIKTIFLETEIN